MTNTYINTEVDNTVYTLSGGDHIFIDKNGSLVGTTGGAYITDGVFEGHDSPTSPVYIDVAGSIFSTSPHHYPITLAGNEQKFVTIRSTASLEGLIGVLAYGPSSINNAGSIVGDLYGVFLSDGSSTLVNSGMIAANGDTSTYSEPTSAVIVGGNGANASATINNSGSIIGINATGINALYLYSFYSNTFAVINSGLIEGGGIAGTYAIQGNTLADTVSNTGTIETLTVGGVAITLGGGADTVTNGGKIIGDVMLGDNNDLFDGRNGTTDGTVFGSAGNDKLYGSNTAGDILDGGAGADYLNGGGGEDTASYADATAGVRAEIYSQALATGDAKGDVFVGIEDLTGSAYADTLSGDANTNVLDGGDGDDTLNGREGSDILFGGGGIDSLSGGSGADTMIGGLGNDNYVVDNTGDTITENAGEGTDTVSTSISYALGDDLENLTLTGTSAINGTGNAFANVLTGNTANNILDGGAGADTMAGGTGNDTYYVGDSADNVVESLSGGTADKVFSSVSYTLSGRYIETLTLTGSGATNATGNSQANTLVGNTGANLLDGGLGSDKLTGGAGGDIFLFDTALGSTNIDTITDFSLGTDLITLDKSIFTALGANGPLAASAFGLGKTAATTAQRILYDSGTGDIYYDKDGTGAAAAVKFATITSGLALTANSFSIQA
jgi:Ca2+-binding RTX toxin-like protein